MSTRQQILDHARSLIQERGYNAVSFRDLSKVVGIKTASIHYHFATKKDLACALIEEETQRLEAFLKSINSLDKENVLLKFAELFLSPLQNQKRFCLCGMLSTSVIDEEVSQALTAFFLICLDFLTTCLKDQSEAKVFLSLCEGGMLIARLQSNPESYFLDLITCYLRHLS